MCLGVPNECLCSSSGNYGHWWQRLLLWFICSPLPAPATATATTDSLTTNNYNVILIISILAWVLTICPSASQRRFYTKEDKRCKNALKWQTFLKLNKNIFLEIYKSYYWCFYRIYSPLPMYLLKPWYLGSSFQTMFYKKFIKL